MNGIIRFGKKVILSNLLRSGQLTSYVNYDDAWYANLGLGEAKEYLVLSINQYAGTTNIIINGKTDVHNNNCVLDLKTGRMWSRYVSASVGPDSNGKLPWTTNVNGEGIFPYCAAANTALLGGYGNWRVANRNEVFLLLNHELNPLSPDTTAFPSFPTGGNQIWSSTTSKSSPTYAWALSYGRFTEVLKVTNYYCCLVRGGG